MVKWQRRLWIAGVGLGTTLLIGLGLLVGSFRIAVQLVPDYRADVEAQVAELLHTPARINQMNLIWRGRYPTLQLHQVGLGEAGQGLYFDELRIGFSLLRLLQGDLMPRRVQLSGTAVRLKRQNGEMQLEGLNPQGGARQAPEELLDRLYEIGRIELADARLLWLDLDHQLPPRELRIKELQAWRSAGDLNIRALARVTGQGEIEVGAILESQPGWQVQELNLELQGMDLWADLQAHLPQLPALKGAVDHLDVAARWQDGEWQTAELNFDLRNISPIDAARGFSHWQGSLLLSAAGPGVRAELQNRVLVASSGRWPESLATLDWQPGITPRGQIKFSAEYLRLDDLLPWAALLPEQPRQQLQQLRPAGEVRDLVLQLDDGATWPRLTVELEQVQVESWGQVPGVRGFSGSLSMAADGGRVLVDSRALILDLPRIFDEPLPLDELSGNLSWQRSAEGWQISAPGLHYAALNLDGVGRLELDLGERPDMELELNFFCTDPLPWLNYQPHHWGEHLQNWLKRAITGANVSSGEVVIRGALGDFPFRDTDGEFKVTLDIEDAGLKFAPDWPAVAIDRAKLLIEGDSLSVEGFDSRIGGLEAERAQARIEDLRTADLVVEARAQGDAKDIWKMLRGSQLRERLGPTLDALDLSGRTDGDLRLVLPLHDLNKTEYEVTAQLDRAALWTRYWPDPIQKISGEVRIDAAGLRSHDLTASVGGIPVTAQLLPENGLTRIEAEFETEIADLPASVPIGDWLRSRAEGVSSWQFSMQVGVDAEQRLSFASNLLGTALNLPSPYGKQADELRRLTVAILPEKEVRLHVTYGQLLGLDGLIVEGEGLRAARLNFGTELLQAGAPGWWVEGQIPQASFAEWQPLISDLVAELSQAEPSTGQGFGGLVLRVGELQALGQQLSDARLQLTRGDSAWDLRLAAPQANGSIRIPHVQSGGRLRLEADFEQLNWAFDAQGQSAAIDPREVPELHLKADNFSLNDSTLGRLVLDLTPVSRGIRIEHLDVYEKERQAVDVQGLWVRDDAGESAALELAIDTRSFSAWLTALGYQDNIVARRGQVEGQLNWAPDPGGLSLSHLNGELNFTFSEGQLLNVEPGAGRVLGLFSINALPRRFFLDFSDVVDSGLGFDRMRGNFSLNDGVADTNDFEMEGPSLRIIARGEVDLAQRLYDQTITIYPGVSSGVSLAATLLGGPVVGIFTLLAQELLDKPLDQVTQISYHLGGSWDSPEVSRNP